MKIRKPTVHVVVDSARVSAFAMSGNPELARDCRARSLGLGVLFVDGSFLWWCTGPIFACDLRPKKLF